MKTRPLTSDNRACIVS